MNKELYHDITKHMYSISLNRNFDRFLIVLNLNIDLIKIYDSEIYYTLYKYYLYIMIKI